jgi:hypothetical protein
MISNPQNNTELNLTEVRPDLSRIILRLQRVQSTHHRLVVNGVFDQMHLAHPPWPGISLRL